jgi:hypothetical protein
MVESAEMLSLKLDAIALHETPTIDSRRTHDTRTAGAGA